MFELQLELNINIYKNFAVINTESSKMLLIFNIDFNLYAQTIFKNLLIKKYSILR